MNNTHRLAVLVSGSGTILEHMIDKKLPISYVIAEKPCRGIDLAIEHRLADNVDVARLRTKILPRVNYGWDNSRKWNNQPKFDRVSFSIDLANILNSYNVTIAAMAGFMTILSPEFFDIFEGTLLNIHPALLPKYKGERAVADALEAGERVTGTTIHIATKELDAGPIIKQAKVPVLPDDTVDTLHERIKQTERPLYTQVLAELLEGKRKLPSR